ncbi:tRNA ligases class I (M) protein [Besnoitia besnoiti]|uniref:tRNA ligases class I (M) protein n=1 Tax=Besnoitia besnoiti TaxID=94643 RepID=A0A2A9MH43_BESBE|nr:tRNA ligases class I (M) protein [Besnoitia besnoiti]PFH34740.1 tRNA ligases class I (M) protein [Besnoitia besnoiti]
MLPGDTQAEPTVSAFSFLPSLPSSSPSRLLFSFRSPASPFSARPPLAAGFPFSRVSAAAPRGSSPLPSSPSRGELAFPELGAKREAEGEARGTGEVDWSAYRLVTCPLFYSNARMHLGHAYSCVLGDALVRERTDDGDRPRGEGGEQFVAEDERRCGLRDPEEACALLTGADEHGGKVVRAAADAWRVHAEGRASDVSAEESGKSLENRSCIERYPPLLLPSPPASPCASHCTSLHPSSPLEPSTDSFSAAAPPSDSAPSSSTSPRPSPAASASLPAFSRQAVETFVASIAAYNCHMLRRLGVLRGSQRGLIFFRTSVAASRAPASSGHNPEEAGRAAEKDRQRRHEGAADEETTPREGTPTAEEEEEASRGEKPRTDARRGEHAETPHTEQTQRGKGDRNVEGGWREEARGGGLAGLNSSLGRGSLLANAARDVPRSQHEAAVWAVWRILEDRGLIYKSSGSSPAAACPPAGLSPFSARRGAARFAGEEEEERAWGVNASSRAAAHSAASPVPSLAASPSPWWEMGAPEAAPRREDSAEGRRRSDERQAASDDPEGGCSPSQEEFYYFRLTHFRDALLDLYASRDVFSISPPSRLEEIKAFVEGGGLRDLAISRPASAYAVSALSPSALSPRSELLLHQAASVPQAASPLSLGSRQDDVWGLRVPPRSFNAFPSAPASPASAVQSLSPPLSSASRASAVSAPAYASRAAQHVVYVWFDALVAYLAAAGFPDMHSPRFQRLWPPSVQVIGKDILRFHAALFPALLLGARLPLPRRLLVHGWWTDRNNKKLSKSAAERAEEVQTAASPGSANASSRSPKNPGRIHGPESDPGAKGAPETGSERARSEDPREKAGRNAPRASGEETPRRGGAEAPRGGFSSADPTEGDSAAAPLQAPGLPLGENNLSQALRLLLNKFGADAVRFFLLHGKSPEKDMELVSAAPASPSAPSVPAPVPRLVSIEEVYVTLQRSVGNLLFRFVSLLWKYEDARGQRGTLPARPLWIAAALRERRHRRQGSEARERADSETEKGAAQGDDWGRRERGKARERGGDRDSEGAAGRTGHRSGDSACREKRASAKAQVWGATGLATQSELGREGEGGGSSAAKDVESSPSSGSGDGDCGVGGVSEEIREACVAFLGEILDFEEPADLCMHTQQFHSYTRGLLQLARVANIFIERMAPWRLLPASAASRAAVEAILFVVAEFLRRLALFLAPVAPGLGHEIFEQLRVPLSLRTLAERRAKKESRQGGQDDEEVAPTEDAELLLAGGWPVATPKEILPQLR